MRIAHQFLLFLCQRIWRSHSHALLVIALAGLKRTGDILRILSALATLSICAGCSSVEPVDASFASNQVSNEEMPQPTEYLEYFDAEVFLLTHAISQNPTRATPRLSHTHSELAHLRETLNEFTVGLLGEAGLSQPLRVELVSRGRVALETTTDGRMLVDVATLRALVDHLAVRYYGSTDAYADMLMRAERNDPSLRTGSETVGVPLAELDRKNVRNWPVFVKQSFMTMATMYGLAYMFLHEAAHVEMKHHRKLASASNDSRCAVLREAELEADDFAVRIMTTKLLTGNQIFFDPQLRAYSGEYNKTFADSLEGFHLAFADIRGLHSGATRVADCTYPSREARLARVRASAEKLHRVNGAR